MVAAASCLNTTIFVGPVAAALGRADVSVVAGLVVGALTYPILLRIFPTSSNEGAPV